MIRANAVRREAWSHTSALLWMIQVACGAKDVEPDTYNPYRERRPARPIPKVGIEALRAIFVDGRMPATNGSKP